MLSFLEVTLSGNADVSELRPSGNSSLEWVKIAWSRTHFRLHTQL